MNEQLPPTAKARASNGRLPTSVDARSAEARRIRDIIAEFVESARGHMTPGELHTAKRCAALIILAEAIEARIVAGEAVDQDQYVRIVGLTRRLLGDLGQLDEHRWAGLDDEVQDLAGYFGSQSSDGDGEDKADPTEGPGDGDDGTTPKSLAIRPRVRVGPRKFHGGILKPKEQLR